ncbi:MAG: pentapeptide repeat-containing protein, partial [Candidatus Nanopelagicales bacterium]|nr:pentapeptide repeat-containing protein [Candidatus Nanopelagicales bacterium]
ANLTGANLTGTNLEGMTWSNTTCPNGKVISTGCFGVDNLIDMSRAFRASTTDVLRVIALD